MALSQIGPNDSGDPFIAKLNAAITEADKVANIKAALDALQVQLAPYVDLVGGSPDRPGDSRTLFTKDKVGSPKGRAAIDKGTVEDGGELGQVLRISGADSDATLGYIDISPRRAYYMRPGRAYLVQHHFRRFQNPSDPLQHAVELRFQNLSSSFAQVSNVRLGNIYQPTEQDGAYFVDTFVGKAGAPGALSYIIPPTSAYGVPYFRIYGNGHQTDLGTVRLYDVSDALAGGADVASILARVKKLEDGQLAGVTYSLSWNDLKSRIGKVAGAGARTPDSDTGTHVDPVTGATVSNAGNFLWSVSPQGWQWVSVTDARQAANFVGAAASVLTDPLADDDGFLVWDASAQAIKQQPFLSLISQLEARVAPPPVYWFKGARAASTTEQTLVAAPAAGAIIQNLRVQNTSKTAYIAVGVGGVTASLIDGGPNVLGPGMSLFLDTFQQGRVSFLSDTEGSPISCTFTSTVNLDPNSADRAAKHLARYGTAMTAPQSTAVANLYSALFDSGWIDLAANGGFIWNGRAPSNFDGLIDWATPGRTFGRTVINNAEPPGTSFSGTLFNGNNGIDTLITPPPAPPTKHSLFLWSDTTASPSGSKVGMGNSVLRVAPNRAATSTTLYTGAGSSIVTSGGLGGLQGYRRDNPDTFRFFRNDAPGSDTTKSVVETTGGSQPILIGGLNTSTGLQFGWTGILEFAVGTFGKTPTDAQVVQLYAALNAYRIALGA